MRFANDPAADSLETFLSLDNVRTNWEAGLLGFAFHPNYPDTDQVFVSYNDHANGGRTTLSRLSLNGGTVIDASTEQVLLTVAQPADNHNGGQIHFGADGFLYIGLGDGGPNPGESQNTGTLLGALLRIDVDRVQAPRAYAIPEDNPFVDNPAYAPEIYAYGLRNPWRWSFDAHTGELWLADVGQNSWEEINRVESGDNLGWPIMEGEQCYGSASCDSTGLTLPVLAYANAAGNCSVTGGFVYRGSAVPGLVGDYIFSDWCSGLIWRAFPGFAGWQKEQIADAWFNVPAFGQGHDGEIYVLNPTGGAGQAIYRIAQTAAPEPGESAVPAQLSATGCYQSTADRALANFVVPYELHAELWSDGAAKRRGFAIPDGSTISLAEDGDFLFPVGSVLIKEFLDGDLPLETRLLMRHQSGWAGYSYEWLPDGSDALLLDAGKTVDTGNFVHTFPSSTQCLVCHTASANHVLGVEASQLDRVFSYPASGEQANQLDALFAAGFLADEPAPPALMAALDDESAPVSVRARSYLHSNCSGCHRPNSTAAALDLRVHTELAATGACDAPTSDPMGLDDPRIIAPGAAARSTLLARMQTLGDKRMPPLASLREDEAATALLSVWIDTLVDCTEAQ